VVPLPGFEDQFGSPGAPPGDDPFGSVDFEADKPAAPAAKPPPPPPPDDDDPFPIDAVAPPPAPKEEPMSFDFAEPKLSQISAAPSAAGSPEMLDFVDDAPKGPGAKKPPPPVIAKEKEKGKGQRRRRPPLRRASARGFRPVVGFRASRRRSGRRKSGTSARLAIAGSGPGARPNRAPARSSGLPGS